MATWRTATEQLVWVVQLLIYVDVGLCAVLFAMLCLCWLFLRHERALGDRAQLLEWGIARLNALADEKIPALDALAHLVYETRGEIRGVATVASRPLFAYPSDIALSDHPGYLTVPGAWGAPSPSAPSPGLGPSAPGLPGSTGLTQERVTGPGLGPLGEPIQPFHSTGGPQR